MHIIRLKPWECSNGCSWCASVAEAVDWLHSFTVQWGQYDIFIYTYIFNNEFFVPILTIVYMGFQKKKNHCLHGVAFFSFLFLIRDSWTISLINFSNFKTKATQILLLKLFLFSLKILTDFLMNLPKLCEL